MNAFTARFVMPGLTSPSLDPVKTNTDMWSQIADFSSWLQWLPAATGITLLDADAVGRGCSFEIQSEIFTELWQVSYWNAGRRIVFQISAGDTRRACAIETRITPENSVELLFEMEFARTGLRRWLAPILDRIHGRRARLHAERLHGWLKKSIPDWPGSL